MTINTVEVMSKGMKCLTDHMGAIEAELFISTILREKFDYTKWQREYFDKKNPKEISEEAVEYAKKNPYKGNATKI